MEIKNIAKLSSYGAYIDEEFIYTNSIVEGKNVIVGDIAEYMYDLEQEIARLKKEKNGRWIYSEKGCVIKCSNCGERLELCYPDGTEIRATKYCPNCGAKMLNRDLTMDEKIEITEKAVRKSARQEEAFVSMLNDEIEMLILSLGYRKESDTAREICDLILEHWEKKQFVECDWLRVAIAEKYGVDLGE